MPCATVGSEQRVHRSAVTAKFSGKHQSLCDRQRVTVKSSTCLPQCKVFMRTGSVRAGEGGEFFLQEYVAVVTGKTLFRLSVQ